MSLLLMGLLACGDKDAATDDSQAGDDTSASADDTGFSRDTGDLESFCADAPVTTYDNFGAGFMTEHCQPCHHSENTDNRQGAPEETSFDTEDEVWAQADRILARATGDSPSMPPQGGVEDDERYRLSVWLRCTEEGS